MKIQTTFLVFYLTFFMVLNSFSQNNNNVKHAIDSKEYLLGERMEKFLANDDYISIEKAMKDKGYTFPAIAIQSNENQKIVLEFRAYKINSSNRAEIKSAIISGVPSISMVEISENFVKATFNANADEFHIKTLFRYLGYDSFILPN